MRSPEQRAAEQGITAADVPYGNEQPTCDHEQITDGCLVCAFKAALASWGDLA